MLARSKLNSVEIFISQLLIHLETSYEEYKTIIKEEKNYRILKENIRMIKSDNKNDE